MKDREHASVADVMHRAEGVVERLFTAYRADRSAMPDAWRPPPSASEVTRARAIADFIAGMTDRYAIAEARRLYPGDPGVG